MSTRRDEIEEALLKIFGNKLRSLDETLIPLINCHKDGVFGFSYLGLMLYTNGNNLLSTSSKYPRGLVYYDGKAIFGVGVFYRKHEPDIPCIHIVAPRGRQWDQEILKFVLGIKKIIPHAKFFVRYLNAERYEQMLAIPSWYHIAADPWNGKLCPMEDETFQHAVVNLEREMPHRRQRNCNSFEKFLQENKLKFLLRKYDPARKKEVAELIEGHFDMLERKGRAIGSTAADYKNFVNVDPEKLHEAGADTSFYLGYLRAGKKEILPVSFFAVEELGDREMIGTFATVTSYDETRAEKLITETKEGFEQIGTYARWKLNAILKSQGYRKLHTGGSETPHLNASKEGDGAEPPAPEDRTNWVTWVDSPSDSLGRC